MTAQNYFSDQSIVVTGGCGTVGKELIHQLLTDYGVKRLVVLDNNESELFLMAERYKTMPHAQFFLADIRDQDKLTRKLQGMDLMLHVAALKHVILCEQSPFEAVQTNVLGVRNVIRAATDAGVEKVLFTSSDKAVNPTNVMGTSKLMGERLMSAANVEAPKTKFFSTRFGNVLGSRGSVIPVFKRHIKNGGPVPLTDPGMTRFIMSVAQAARLVLDSVSLTLGGEVFVTKMPVISIKDLAEVMIEELAPRYGHNPQNIPIEIIGAKPGEKLYEELMTGEETVRALEMERYFVVKPAFLPNFQPIAYEYPGLVSSVVDNPYNSANEPKMCKDELRAFLWENALLDDED